MFLQGLFIKFSDASYNFVTVKNSNICSNEVISSRKRNFNTDLKEISNKEFSLKLYFQTQNKISLGTFCNLFHFHF